jgi:pimeloyl-ACP methyl ester carboxylesterase
VRRLVLTLLVLLVALAFGPPLLAPLAGWEPDPATLPPHAKSVTLADGRSLHVMERGEGTPVVLVHGLPSCAADWAELPARLVERGPYRVIAYDRIGFGYSSREADPEEGYTYQSNARELGALLDALGIEAAALVGWSYGGGVVQTFARQHPDRVTHLVLVGSVGPEEIREESLLDAILGSPAGVAILKWVGSVPLLSKRMTRDTLVQAFAREEAIPEGWIEYTRALLSLPGTLEAFVHEAQRGDFATLKPEEIEMPSLVIHGAEDYLIPYTVGEDLHRRLPDSRFAAVLSGSHMLPVTHPDLLADKIHDLIGAY